MKTKMKLTLRYLGVFTLMSFLVVALSNNAHAELPEVTPEMVADGSEEGDLAGQAIYKYLSLGGDPSTLTAEQKLAAEGYYDRYDNAPFFGLSSLWILIAAFLVFIMHLGFATLESGLTQSKNTVNILFKNVYIISAGLILYMLWGFNAMYPGDYGGWFAMGSPWFGTPADNADLSYGGTGLCQTGWADFLFQAMFCATAATIVSGAVAERIKLGSFMIFAALLVGLAYPISGGWKWGGGWLDQMGFYDFAGSSVVHAFGGFAALACCVILGARKGKYTKDGIKPILASSMPLACIGVFLLWLGWFGFNGGSVLSADPGLVSYVCVTTALAAAAGALASIVISALFLKKPDLSMALNGILAGLVGITAGADSVTIPSAMIIGLIAGTIVVFSIVALDKMGIDDPVGAISVHGVVGIWGTLAVGIPFFQLEGVDVSFVTQLIGTLSISAFAFGFSAIVFTAIKAIMGVRVSEEIEAKGLDVTEHGAPAYCQSSTITAAPEPAVATVEA